MSCSNNYYYTNDCRIVFDYKDKGIEHLNDKNVDGLLEHKLMCN